MCLSAYFLKDIIINTLQSHRNICIPRWRQIIICIYVGAYVRMYVCIYIFLHWYSFELLFLKSQTRPARKHLQNIAYDRNYPGNILININFSYGYMYIPYTKATQNNCTNAVKLGLINQPALCLEWNKCFLMIMVLDKLMTRDSVWCVSYGDGSDICNYY